MHRPTCELHPTGHVKRDGHYGARKQYVRWRCIPGNGERPHNVRPVLALKQHGSPDGDCLECEREWGELDGMPAGTGDRFTLREKAAALVALSQGASYRAAAERARLRGGLWPAQLRRAHGLA